MSLELCILASGSTGNAAVVRTAGGVVMIDAGIGPRVTAKRLSGLGVQVSDIAAICLTHLDSDHFCQSWANAAIQRGIPIHCHESCVRDAVKIAADDRVMACVRPFREQAFDLLPGLSATPIALAHDQEGSHGFVLESSGKRLGYATDLGRVPKLLIEAFVDLDVLAIESNYDPQMQADSPRPYFLKQRITGGRGHLSNQQALDAVRQMLDLAEESGVGLPSHIVLLHRSRQCNCPKLVRALFTRDARIAARLTLAEPFARSEWLAAPGRTASAGEQLLLSWGSDAFEVRAAM